MCDKIPDNIRLDFDVDNPFIGVSPLQVITVWMADAQNSELNDPSAMAIATIGADGYPQNRMVLCRGLNAKGVIFYTNKHSDKGRALSENPKISALFHWKSLRRQIRLVGTVEPVPAHMNQQYFSTRGVVSQLGAWASKQSAPLDSRKILQERLQRVTEKYGNRDPIPCPDFWGGFQIVVESIEFWCDGKHRLHNRFILTKTGATSRLDTHRWHVQRLYP